MSNNSAKEHFKIQYKKNAFFSPKDIQFVIYDKKIWSFAKELLRDSKAVADIGAGGGTLLYNISKITTHRSIYKDNLWTF